jgi:hypothetical protein
MYVYESSNFPNETPLKSPSNPLEIPLNLYESKVNIILMILEVNKLQKCAYNIFRQDPKFSPFTQINHNMPNKRFGRIFQNLNPS